MVNGRYSRITVSLTRITTKASGSGHDRFGGHRGLGRHGNRSVGAANVVSHHRRRAGDSSGAPIPGVVIRLLSHAETAASVEAVSDAQGVYSVTALAPAQYRLEARLDGFEPIVRVVALTLGQAAEIDITLKPARFTEGVIVTARRVEEVAQEVPIPVSVISTAHSWRTQAPST